MIQTNTCLCKAYGAQSQSVQDDCSFVNEFSVTTPMSQFIRTNCFPRHKIVQYMVCVGYAILTQTACRQRGRL